MPRLEFTINVRPFGTTAQKDAAKLTGELRAQDKEMGKLNKSTLAFSKEYKKQTDLIRRSTSDAASLVEGMASRINRVNERIGESFKRTFEKVKDHIKEAFTVSTGMFMHDAIEKIVDLPKKLLEAGRGNVEARERLIREFGRGDAGAISRRAALVGRRAGFDDSVALTSLFPVAEAVDSVQAGTVYRGRRLNDGQASALRASLFGKGAGLFERISTVMRTTPEESQQLGYLLANAGTGPEGMRGLVASLHLNRAFSARLLQANAKGRAVDMVDPAIAKELGLKRGQQIGQGDIIDILLRKSGITDKAAEDERRKFGFQIKSIGATFESALGDVGERVLNKVSNGFGKGTTLAEKFQKALESDRGKKTIDAIADGLVKAADGAIKLAGEVPKFVNFLEKHEGTMKLLGGAYVGVSLFSKGKGIAEKVSDIAGNAKPIHVWVDNLGAGKFGEGGGGSTPGGGGSKLEKAGKVLGALTTGYAIGTALDEALGISDFLSHNNDKEYHDADAKAFAADEQRRRNRRVLRSMSSQLPADVRARYDALTNDATKFDASSGAQKSALAQLQQIINQFHLQPPAVNVYVGGHQVTAVVEREQVRRAKNETANGAAR